MVLGNGNGAKVMERARSLVRRSANHDIVCVVTYSFKMVIDIESSSTRLCVRRLTFGLLVCESLIIDIDDVVSNLDSVTRCSHDTFDESYAVGGGFTGDNIARLYITPLREPDHCEGDAHAVGEFVDEDAVADLDCRDHRACGDIVPIDDN